jgi:hypothetical protein
VRIAEAASTGISKLRPGKPATPLAALVLVRYLPEAVRVADLALLAESKGRPDPETVHTLHQALVQLEKLFFRFADADEGDTDPVALRELNAALSSVDATRKPA